MPSSCAVAQNGSYEFAAVRSIFRLRGPDECALQSRLRAALELAARQLDVEQRDQREPCQPCRSQLTPGTRRFLDVGGRETIIGDSVAEQGGFEPVVPSA